MFRLAKPLPGLAALVLAGCAEDPWPAPPPLALDQLVAEHEEWREYRRGRLVTPPGGAVLWVGLFPLAQGENPLGSDASLPIVLPEADAPPLAGTLHRSGQEVRLDPEAAGAIRLEDGSPITEARVLGDDRSDDPTTLSLGSLGLRIHAEPGTDRLWLRVWDEDLALRETFTLPEPFPPDTAWRMTARYEPYREPRQLRFADVTGGTIGRQAPGELVFRKEGHEHRLIAVADPGASRFFVMMWDSTANTETYQAGRYLGVPFPEVEGWTPASEGWTTIDFNRAYNAPCVFTAYSVCSLPPPENRLALRVTAGEKRPATPFY